MNWKFWKRKKELISPEDLENLMMSNRYTMWEKAMESAEKRKVDYIQ